MKIFWTREALSGLNQIQKYISQDNPETAVDFLNKIISVAETLADNPEKGRVVPELSLENIREFIYRKTELFIVSKKVRLIFLRYLKDIGCYGMIR